MKSGWRLYTQIVAEKWVPALIIGIIGGWLIAKYTPHYQTQYVKQHTYDQRKIEIWESIGSNFVGYRFFKDKLIVLENCRLNNVCQEPLPDEYYQRQEDYRFERDSYRANLQSNFIKVKYYYSDDVYQLILQYLAWHNLYATAEPDQLPPDEDYEDWQNLILFKMLEELPS